jgi:hypothetical protein
MHAVHRAVYNHTSAGPRFAFVFRQGAQAPSDLKPGQVACNSLANAFKKGARIVQQVGLAKVNVLRGIASMHSYNQIAVPPSHA